MSDFENFLLQARLFGLKPKVGLTYQDIYDKGLRITGDPVLDLNHEKLSLLWSDFELDKPVEDWPPAEFKPEKAILKRALKLGDKLVNELSKSYLPTQENLSPDWRHLVQHGKLGLMAVLFAFEKHDKNLKLKNVASVVDLFMAEMESLFLDMLAAEQSDLLAKALKIRHQRAGESMHDYVQCRLQPFALMRGLYMDGASADLSPMQWWTMNERFLPDVPVT